VFNNLDRELFDAEAFDKNPGQSELLELYRQNLKHGRELLYRRFLDGADTRLLVYLRSWHVDQILVRAFQHFVPGNHCSLLAVGGYGRGELHPASDIDLLILLPEQHTEAITDQVSRLITFLWDIGLDVGHAVRTVAETISAAREDITIATNILESRWLHGDRSLVEQMQAGTDREQIWSSREFFMAKRREQNLRHGRFHDTAYNLEPNIKEGPGGLRDIQVIDWVAKRHFGTYNLHDLVHHDFLTEDEYKSLAEGQDFLWRVRFGLHVITGRREDRLLFDHQRTLARQFGFEDDDARLGVEHFMKRYYRTIMELARLNEMLLQLFEEEILLRDEAENIQPLNKRFQLHNGYIEATYDAIFQHYPFALLEIFLVIAQHPEIKGVRASTIRALRSHRHLINYSFRADLRCRSLFIELLRQPQGVTHELRRMNRYGILAAYLPVFGNISGQMQYDLFHHYTVDEHTLFVLRNLRRLTVERFYDEFPMCSAIMRTIAKQELLLLAALFHDIAKGRGGDHSDLGAGDAEEFCQNHGLSEYDTKLVSWLVRNHLLMSVTAQRKDISDADVVNEFASIVGNQSRLDYLYLLTVADIRATNPELWNSWKDALLKELYYAASHVLRRGIGKLPDQREWVESTRDSALQLLRRDCPRLEQNLIFALWHTFPDDYFLRYSAERVAWHAQVILENPDQQLPLIRHAPVPEIHTGATEIFIYAHNRRNLFANATAIIDTMGLTIVDARIITTEDDCTLDSFILFEQTGDPIAGSSRVQEIIAGLSQSLYLDEAPHRAFQRYVPRRLKHFDIPVQIAFFEDPKQRHTVLEVIAADRPGLLAILSKVFLQCGVGLRNAKISTIGERAEDIFFIVSGDNSPVTDTSIRTCLQQNILDKLRGN